MKKIILSLFVLAGLVACNEKSLTPGGGEQSGKIRFLAGGPALTANVSTKATVVTGADLDTYGFLANAVKGTAGTDTEVWTNQEFTKVGDAWEQDKWWPNTNSEPYRFYAVYPKTYTTTFAAGGPTISASNAHDIICAYAANPTYKSVNTLSFDHIFARLTDVTVSAVSPYTISDVSISITPLVSGTYNLYTGAGQTDGTGWSNTSPAASASVIASATGTNNNDIYLVPGSYTLTASWTATKDNYTQTFTGKTVDVDLVAGKTNKITASLTGDGTEIKFSVSVTAWEDNTIDAGTFPVEPQQPAHSINGKFTINAQGDQVWFSEGNLQCTIASGPTDEYNYVGTDWSFASNQWDYLGDTDGANSFIIGKKNDLFGWVGTSASYDTYGLCSDTSNNNEYYGTSSSDALKTDWGDIPGFVSNYGAGWFTPSNDDWGYVFNTRTTGNTVNGTPDARYAGATIRTDVSGVKGIILFPDDYSAGTPSGVTWGTINAASAWGTQCTAAGWASLEAAGCVFIPAAGSRYEEGFNGVGGYGWYWSSSPFEDLGNFAYYVYVCEGGFSFGGKNPRPRGLSVRLVKAVQ